MNKIKQTTFDSIQEAIILFSLFPLLFLFQLGFYMFVIGFGFRESLIEFKELIKFELGEREEEYFKQDERNNI